MVANEFQKSLIFTSKRGKVRNKIRIAIDGPAGSGKSTIARAVALKLGYTYIDTGAMYRAITLKALNKGIEPTDITSLTRLAEESKIELLYEPVPGGTKLRLILDGSDVSETIRNQEVTANVSAVAAVAGVRAALVRLQQGLAAGGGVVMDGRDIGTVVLPGAELKIFLTASVEERARRRCLELSAKGLAIDADEIRLQIEKRDQFDSSRKVDPLCQAAEAILLDTTGLTIPQVVDRVIELAVVRGAELPVGQVPAQE